MNSFDKAILGAGWAGLLIAQREQKIGIKNLTLIEADKKENFGGLLKSIVIDGFTFDIGGPHLIFSKDKTILSEIVKLLGENCSLKVRNNFVYYDNEFVPYPFENGIYKLSPEKRVKFIKGIIERMIYIAKNDVWKPETFLDWIIGFFGDYMANEYLIPYNKKIWKRPLDKIASDWVFIPGRLPFPNLEAMIKSAAGIPNIGYEEQANFYYPKRGGIQSLFNSLFDKVINNGIRVIDNERITKIDMLPNGKFLINEKFEAKKIVNTIPLPEILTSLGKNDEYYNLANKFDYNSVVIVGVAINSKTPEQTTIYVPDPKIIFHRYTWMSSLIPSSDPSKSNLIAEITVPKGERIDTKKIKLETIKNLADIGAIKDENDVIFSKAWINKYGYPIYTLDHNYVRNEATHILKENGIISVGRWGSWHYWNTDMVYKAVYDVEI
ncbi:protoporphyrinogen/coproporphyrinogen oxidase [Caldisphaera sp.]|uniref:protoporphyrinogen/coproporphyrinogen oxidase n=1 Tax=Caldisphaera sp. TaxID=2060322 RepID=UPI00397D21E0